MKIIYEEDLGNFQKGTKSECLQKKRFKMYFINVKNIDKLKVGNTVLGKTGTTFIQ